MVRLTIGLALLAGFGLLGTRVAGSQRGADARSAAVTFRDVSREAGLAFRHVNGASPEKHFPETMGSGGLFFDFDADGWVDVFLVDGGSEADPAVARSARHRLFHNRGDGTYEDVTDGSGLRHGAYGMGACAGDYDNDGRVDLYVTSVGPNHLYRNTGGGRFTDVTGAAGVGSPRWSTSCAFADFDLDGDLDLFVTNYVDTSADPNRYCGFAPERQYCHPLNFDSLPNLYYRNDGGRFADATALAGIADLRGNGLGVAVGDYDDDGRPDVFVANDATPDFLFRNDGKGGFEETGLLAGVSVATDGQARAGMGTSFGVADGDGRLDLIVTNHETEMASLFHNAGGGLFDDATVSSGVGRATLPWVGFGVVFLDYDNDADLDLAVVNGHVIDNVDTVRSGGEYAQPRLLLANADGRFTDVSGQAGPAFAVARVGRGLATADVDNDGDLDMLVTSNGGPAELIRNEGGSAGGALLLRLVGTTANRDALGARVLATVGARTLMREVTGGSSYLGHGDTRVHIGLGEARAASRLEIRWPGGRTEELRDVAAGIVTIREGEGVVSRAPFAR
jgi:hypothetical protein